MQNMMTKSEKYTLWLFNIAIENGPFIDDFPLNTSIYKGFSMAMLVITRWYMSTDTFWSTKIIQLGLPTRRKAPQAPQVARRSPASEPA